MKNKKSAYKMARCWTKVSILIYFSQINNKYILEILGSSAGGIYPRIQIFFLIRGRMSGGKIRKKRKINYKIKFSKQWTAKSNHHTLGRILTTFLNLKKEAGKRGKIGKFPKTFLSVSQQFLLLMCFINYCMAKKSCIFLYCDILLNSEKISFTCSISWFLLFFPYGRSKSE